MRIERLGKPKMTRVISKPGRFSACLFGMVALAVPLAVSGALAQTVDAPKPQKSQKAQKTQAKSGEGAAGAPSDRAQAEQAYANGVRAYDAGRLPEAVTSLSNALVSGGLPNPQMARALYLRGTAYRKQGQPALAYTDLTSALWLKNGLAEPDKSKATAEREAAHREAGLGNQAPPIPGADGAKSKTASAPGQPAPGAPKPGVDVASAPTNSSVLDALNPMNLFSSGSTKPAAQPQPPAQAAPVAAASAPQATAAEPTVSSWATTSSPTTQQAQAMAPAAGYAEAAPQQTAAAQPDALSSATNAVTGFFGSVFGTSSGSTATAQPSSPVMTASTGPMAAPQAAPMAAPDAAMSAPPAQAAPQAQAGGGAVPWSNPDGLAAPEAAPAAAGVQAQKKAAKTQMAAAAPGPQAQAIKPSAKGKYRLQVATVNTREEADKIAANVAGNPVISGAQPEVDSVVYGNMGTFFRVRVGPYATSAQPAELCKQLRPQGYDCLVVTN